MALQAKNYRLATYTIDTWTDLVLESSAVTINSFVIASDGVVSVQVRITDLAGGLLVLLVPATPLAADSSYTVDVSEIILTRGQKIQVHASVIGVTFYAFGGVEA